MIEAESFAMENAQSVSQRKTLKECLAVQFTMGSWTPLGTR